MIPATARAEAPGPSAGVNPHPHARQDRPETAHPRLRRRRPAHGVAQSAVAGRSRGTGPLRLRPGPALLRHVAHLHGEPGDSRRGAQGPPSRGVPGDEGREHQAGGGAQVGGAVPQDAPDRLSGHPPDSRHAGTGADERRAGDEDSRRAGQAPRRASHPLCRVLRARLLRQGAGPDHVRRIRPVHVVLRLHPPGLRPGLDRPHDQTARCLRGQGP